MSLKPDRQLVRDISNLLRDYEKEHGPWKSSDCTVAEGYEHGRFWHVSFSPDKDLEGTIKADGENTVTTILNRYAGKIIAEIILDIQNRSGFEDVWEQFDDDIKFEIVLSWHKGIEEILQKGLPELGEEDHWFATSMLDVMKIEGKGTVYKEE